MKAVATIRRKIGARVGRMALAEVLCLLDPAPRDVGHLLRKVWLQDAIGGWSQGTEALLQAALGRRLRKLRQEEKLQAAVSG